MDLCIHLSVSTTIDTTAFNRGPDHMEPYLLWDIPSLTVLIGLTLLFL